ncbi:MAG: polysaccharide deacetylase family protein [Candidatus Methylacidiphilales bacterium]
MKRAQFLQLLGAGAGSLLCGRSWAETAELSVSSVEPLEGETQLNAHFVNKGPGLGRRVALTYDDGPTPKITDRILKELSDRKLTATFFMIGNKVRQFQALAREVAAAGHELANHTFTHPALSKLPDNLVHQELDRCQDAIGEVTGKKPVWFRPPYGAFHTPQGRMPRSKHLGVAYWSVDPQDWKKPGAAVISQRILSKVQPGSIILLHDLHTQSAEATPAVLDGLMERGYFLSPMSGFLGDPYGSYFAS